MSEPRFNHLFAEWAEKYDETVYSSRGEYQEVFEGYEGMLRQLIKSLRLPPRRRLLEIGVGTGNLTRLLLAQDWEVIGIEPSPEMRQLALAKLGIPIEEGHFLDISPALGNFDGIASSFSFHHLTDPEKAEAFLYLSQRLNPGGIIAFVDTAYQDEEAKKALYARVKEQGFRKLLSDLETEYYPFIETIRKIVETAGLSFDCRPLNRFAWLMCASSKH